MMSKKYLVAVSFLFYLFSTTLFGFTVENHLLPNKRNTIEVFKRIAPLVVNVHNLQTVTKFNKKTYNVNTRSASGFLWNNRGYIVTNYHVVRNANKIAITFQRGKTVKANLIGADARLDIAVLKLTSPNTLKSLNSLRAFTHFPVANSADLAVGQKTIAIGNPFGLDQTVTTGIISALGRSLKGIRGIAFRNMIQTDASINLGNSGGPLLDSRGFLIGMNSAIIEDNGSYSGIGFAVPSNIIKRIVEQLIRYGKIKQAGIGVEVLSDRVAKRLQISGVIISKVRPNTPAEKAGLQGSWHDREGQFHLGDVIIGINGRNINNYDQLYDVLAKIKIGSKIEVKYIRRGQILKVKVATINVS